MRFALASPVLLVSEYVKFIPSAMLLPSVHRSFDVGGLNIEGPAPENPPLIAIITTLTKIPIPANIPVATKIVLFGLISNYRYCKKDFKIKLKMKKRLLDNQAKLTRFNKIAWGA